MRVIAGRYKGRKLNTLDGLTTRPTLDRTKETLFNLLGQNLDGLRCIDLFAGSGQIGIEMLSRGADNCVFVEMDKKAAEVVRGNLKMLALDSVVYVCDYKTALQQLDKQCCDLIYVDPPYDGNLYEGALAAITDNKVLNADGEVVCESDAALPNVVGGLVKYREKKVGRVIFTFYRQEEVL
jgi:16S rRNA (guanine(966)-N(2))-methyltransferase RsmD